MVLRWEPQYYGSYTAFNVETAQTDSLSEAELKALKRIYSEPAETTEIAAASGMKTKECEKFLKQMTKRGICQTNQTEPTKPPLRNEVNTNFAKFPIPFLSAPATVDFAITSRCNLHCVHCYVERNECQKQDLPLGIVESVLNQLEQMGVLEVRITGGEPLLHQNIAEILRLLGKKRFRKVLLTNGTLLTEEIVFLIKASKITPTVSLDDADEQTHDAFRGQTGAHKRTLEGLALLQKHQVEYGVNFCLNRKNLERYQEVIDLAAKYGAARIALLDLKPTGQMKNNLQWMPTNKEYCNITKKLLIAIAKNRKIEVSLDAYMHCYPMQEATRLLKKGLVSCKAGIARLSIASDGGVYPCNSVLEDPHWRMGDLKREPLLNIWFSDKWMFFRGQTKVGSLHKCGTCKKFKGCKDIYCRLIPYAVSGNELGAPPQCSV